jgi:hypothetical protein
MERQKLTRKSKIEGQEPITRFDLTQGIKGCLIIHMKFLVGAVAVNNDVRYCLLSIASRAGVRDG